MGILGFNLVDELTFYGQYHANPINQIIHFIFVPLILWTVAVWLAYTPAFAHPDLQSALAFLPSPLLQATRSAGKNFFVLFTVRLHPSISLLRQIRNCCLPAVTLFSMVHFYSWDSMLFIIQLWSRSLARLGQ